MGNALVTAANFKCARHMCKMCNMKNVQLECTKALCKLKSFSRQHVRAQRAERLSQTEVLNRVIALSRKDSFYLFLWQQS